MSKKKQLSEEMQALRESAEKRLLPGDKRNIAGMTTYDIAELIHELETSQVELEMQNEELHSTHNELIETRDRYTDLYDLAPIGYLTTDMNGLILQANQKIMTMLDVPSSSLVNHLLPKYINPQDQDIYYHHRRSVLKTRKEQSCELRLRKKSDDLFWVRLDSACMEGSENEDKQIKSTLSDISERKLLEEQFLQSQKMESLGTLAGGIAHDFNNMLAIIMGNATLLLRQSDENGSAGHHVKAIMAAGNRSIDLVKQVLTFSRMDNSHKQALDPCLVVAEALQMLRASIPTNIEIKQDVPETCQKILADKIQIHQIMMNLVINASHAMEENGGVLEVTLKEKQCEMSSVSGNSIKSYKHCIVLTVSDTGCGISQENRGKIFDPFFSTKDVGKGTGLGLAVVYSLVKQHDGEITVDSEVNKGTTFTIRLPTITEKEKPVIPKPTEVKDIIERSGHILLVEDEVSLAEMYLELLEDIGYTVTVCNEGASALKLFQQNPAQFDLVITDQAMPNMTGKQLSQELVKIKPDIPIILCTGYSSVVSEENADMVGVREFLIKPIKLSTFLQVIDKCLRSR